MESIFSTSQHINILYLFLNSIIVYVKETQKSNGGERLYDSRHACLYCGLMQPKLSRHLLTHIVEEEVKKVKDLALKSKERKHLLKALRLKGTFTTI